MKTASEVPKHTLYSKKVISVYVVSAYGTYDVRVLPGSSSVLPVSFPYRHTKIEIAWPLQTTKCYQQHRCHPRDNIQRIERLEKIEAVAIIKGNHVGFYFKRSLNAIANAVDVSRDHSFLFSNVFFATEIQLLLLLR